MKYLLTEKPKKKKKNTTFNILNIKTKNNTNKELCSCKSYIQKQNQK